MSQCGIDDNHREWIAQPLAQRNCERQSRKAGSADDNLGVRVRGIGFVHAPSL
jgi:hypothetical protein